MLEIHIFTEWGRKDILSL